MKKILVLFIAFLSSLNLVFADEPVQLVAPRVQASATSAPRPAAKTVKHKKNVKKHVKRKKVKIKTKKHIIKTQTKTDYAKIEKLLENGFYDSADNIILNSMSKNPLDVKVQALWAISLAKQSKLDPAQKILTELLKKHPGNSDLHYAQGVVYYQRTTSSNMIYRENTQKYFEDAMKEFKKTIELNKSDAKAYNAAGVLAIKLDKRADARNYFKKAFELDKTYSVAIDNLGTMDFTDGKISDAQKKFEQALSLNTQNSTAMYHLAQVAVKKNDFARALKYLNNALAIDPDSPAIYNLMGKAYYAQGNDAAAIEAFKKSLAKKPEFLLSYLDLADVYMRRGDGELAIEKLKTALCIQPDYYNAKLKLADISFGLGKYQQAAEVYAQLADITSYNSVAVKGLANSYYEIAKASSAKSALSTNKDLLKALDYINKAAKANPQDLDIHLAKVKLEDVVNKADTSIDAQLKIINSNDNSLMGNILKGEAYLKINDYTNAQKTFNSALNQSNGVEQDLALSEIMIYHKQYEIAQKLLQRVLKEDSENQQALNNMDYIKKSKKYADSCYDSAISFLKSRNNASAIEYLSRSLSVNPYNAQANLLLAELYEKQNDVQNAVKYYKVYVGMEPNSIQSKTVGLKIKRLDSKL